jgi:poly(ADP-ribose) glycohydrolase
MEGMENREDLKSMLPFLPLLLGSSSLFWPSKVVKSLETLSKGPLYSEVDSGELLFNAISHIRDSLALPSLQPVAPFAHGGYALFFDEVTFELNSVFPFLFWVLSFLLRLSSFNG